MFTLCMSRGANKQIQDTVAKPTQMVKQVKGGYLLKYKRGWLWSHWSEEWVVLYEDSTVAWFKDKGTQCPRGRVRLNENPELLAVGDWTQQIPQRPRVPKDCHVGQLLAFCCRKRGKVHWLMAQSSAEVSDWMTAISNTLPEPPRLTIKRAKRCSMTVIRDQNGYTNGCNNSVERSEGNTSRQRSSSPDHTVPPGVVIDWGHGWGWGETAWAAQLACADDMAAQLACADDFAAMNTALYCTGVDNLTGMGDFNVGGYDSMDYSACADFSF